MTTATRSIEELNARFHSPQEIADTFVPSEAFRKLARGTHSVIAGPRGSGKTTLLKMLQPQALAVWTHEDAAAIRAEVPYWGIYVPADLSWGEQLKHLGSGNLTESSRDVLGRAAMTTHVLRQFLSTLLFLLNTRPLLSGKEVKAVRQLATVWQVAPEVPSIRALQLALTSRLVHIGSIASRASSDPRAVASLTSEEGLHLQVTQALIAGMDVFNELLGSDDHPWALLFDELEIAPHSIRSHLIQAMRSVDQRLRLKLSISPVSAFFEDPRGALGIGEHHDFEIIPLWHHHKDDARAFSRTLCESILKKRTSADVTLDQLLGRSTFEPASSEIGASESTYRPGTVSQVRLKQAASNDPTFSEYLEHEKIDLEKIGEIDGTTRAKTLRKIYPIVVFRETYRKPHESAKLKDLTRRSRKNPGLFSGAEAMIDACDGNPRWLIVMMNASLDSFQASSGRVSSSKQETLLRGIASRVRAHLNTIAIVTPKSGKVLAAADLIDAIGYYFHRVLIDESFSPDPPGTFTVDESVSLEIHNALGEAVNMGAVVYVDESHEAPIMGSLYGRRFRLSYVLSAEYRVMMRLGRPISLTSILGKEPMTMLGPDIFDKP